MSQTPELLLAIPPAVPLIVGALFALMLFRRQGEGGEGGGGGGGGQTPRPAQPRELVNVHVDKHGGVIKIRVDPWLVDVRKGAPLRWQLHSSTGATMRIEPKSPGDWPFDKLPPQAPVQAGGAVNAGRVKGRVETQHAYSILVNVDGQELDIDPEIWICF